MQSLYRSALALRRASAPFGDQSLEWLPAPDGCLALRRSSGPVCLVNMSGAPVPLPEGRVLPAGAEVGDGSLPDDATVWLTA